MGPQCWKPQRCWKAAAAALALLLTSASSADARGRQPPEEGDAAPADDYAPPVGPPADYVPPPPEGAPTGGDSGVVKEEKEEETTNYGIFQGNVGLLSLPAAELCPISEAECEPAETGIALSLQSMARIGDFGLGGGITVAFGLRPTTVAGYSHLEREHARTYFMVEGKFRYYFIQTGGWHWWVTGSGGMVVVNDAWSTPSDREPYADTAFVGPRAVTLRTEGATVGIGLGGHWQFYDQLMFGSHFTYRNWILPEEREQTPLEGNQASLAGRLDVIDAGITLGYILPI